MVNWMDMFILLAIATGLYHFFKKTEAVHLFGGIVVIVLLFFIAKQLELHYTSLLFHKFLGAIGVGFVVVFQPELRLLLKRIAAYFYNPRSKNQYLSEIEDAVFSMAESKTGALLIFDTQGKVAFGLDDKVQMDAVCSREIIETIFMVNTPLHDGAVLIENNRITYAGVKLPLSGQQRDEYEELNLGTRHLAALETSENFHVWSIVVSEEKGTISIVTSKGFELVHSREEFRKQFIPFNGKREGKIRKWMRGKL